MAISIDFILEI